MSRPSPDRNVEAVRELLLARSLAGLNKYGVTTERSDLSPDEWVQHLQDELMDGAIYCERIKGFARTIAAGDRMAEAAMVMYQDALPANALEDLLDACTEYQRARQEGASDE